MCCRGTYAPEKDTWATRSDLTMGNYDPYPEFVPASERNVREGYMSGDPSDCGSAYNWGLRRINEIPLQQRTLLMREGYSRKENYVPCCRPQPFVPISRTWAPQKPFTL